MLIQARAQYLLFYYDLKYIFKTIRRLLEEPMFQNPLALVLYQWSRVDSPLNQMKFQKVPGAENPSDALTKPVDQATLEKHLATMGIIRLEGRAEVAPAMLARVPHRSGAVRHR